MPRVPRVRGVGAALGALALVWVALVVLTVDLIAANRRRGPRGLPASAESA